MAPQGRAAGCWQSWCHLISNLVLHLQMYGTDTSERDSKAAVVRSPREFDNWAQPLSALQFTSCPFIPLKTNGEESKQSIKQGGHWLPRRDVAVCGLELITAVIAAKGLGWFLLLCMQKVWLGWGRRLEPVDNSTRDKFVMRSCSVSMTIFHSSSLYYSVELCCRGLALEVCGSELILSLSKWEIWTVKELKLFLYGSGVYWRKK